MRFVRRLLPVVVVLLARAIPVADGLDFPLCHAGIPSDGRDEPS